MTLSRKFASFVTSTSTTVVSCAVACIDATARSASTLRSRDIGCVVPRSGEISTGAGAAAAAGCSAAGADAAAAALSTSSLRMRPPTPVPVTDARSTPCCCARRRTSGVTYETMSESSASAAGAGARERRSRSGGRGRRSGRGGRRSRRGSRGRGSRLRRSGLGRRVGLRGRRGVGLDGLLGRRRLRSGLGGSRSTLVADARECRADGDRLVLLDEDLLQHAGERRRDLGVDLVGRDLEQRLVDVDRVADLLQPAGDGALGDALAEFGQDDVLAAGCRGLRGGRCGLLGRGLGSRAPRPRARRPGFGGGAAGASAAGASARSRLGRRRCRLGGRTGAVADLRENRADLDGLVLLDEDLFDHAADGRRDLGVDLVGRDLEQAFVGLDGVADLLQPAGDRSLGDALAERGEDHGSAHGLVSFRMPMSF